MDPALALGDSKRGRDLSSLQKDGILWKSAARLYLKNWKFLVTPHTALKVDLYCVLPGLLFRYVVY